MLYCKMRFLVILLSFLLIPALSHALTFTVTGTVVDASYAEPTTNTDGSPLTDLSKTTVYYDIGSGPVVAKEIPATSPKGGGVIQTAITVPILEGMEKDVTFWAIATDASGNQSVKSNTVTIRIDRLAPNPPQ